MGLLLFILIVELLLLYLLSRRMTQNLYVAAFLLTKSREISVGFLSLIFFPGTVIHELAHLFTAEILGVKTSGLTLVPEGLEKTEVRTGSVSIAITDPIRRAIIGVAPVFVGLAALGVISYFLPQATNWGDWGAWGYMGLGYLLFAVSNTMFSSPEDMEGFWPVALVITIVAVGLYIVGIRISLTDTITNGIQTFLTGMATNIGWVTGLNIALFLLSKLLISGVEKVTKRRLVTK